MVQHQPRGRYATKLALRGCPGIEVLKRGCTIAESRQLTEMKNLHNPVGVAVVGPFTQASREARQPWAWLRNRFAVQTTLRRQPSCKSIARCFITLTLCTFALAVSSQAQNPPPNTETLKKANTRPAEPSAAKTDPWKDASIEKMTGQCVTLDTESGLIVFEVLPGKAPETVRSFLNLVASGALDTTTFSRVVKGFVIQGGNLSTSEKWSAELSERMSRRLPDEPSDVEHVRAIVSMARGDEPNSATTHFFILVGDGPHLNKKFAAFGRVTIGIEVADAINRAPSEDEKPVVPVRIKHTGVSPCQK